MGPRAGLIWLLLVAAGCTSVAMWSGAPPSTLVPYVDSPVFVPAINPEQFWETLVDVTDDYFEVEREEPVRVVDNVWTEGWLETRPKVGATLLEPWHRDSAGAYERMESTLQTVRRRGEIRAVPAQGGYLVHVAVFKELEEVAQPLQATAGAATFRNDSSLARVVNPVGEQETNVGWIPRGRDVALEQRILWDLMRRFGLPEPRPAAPAVPLSLPPPPPPTCCG